MSKIKDTIIEKQDTGVDRYGKGEVKCEGCGVGLKTTKRYGRNICNKCEEKLLDYYL